jgi:cryptochrome
MSGGSAVAVHWFRKGLRLHDNPALVQACSSARVYPVFVLDPHFADPCTVGVNRYSFLLQSLADLDAGLRSLGSRLYLLRGSPEALFPVIFESWGVDTLTFETDAEPYALERDCRVRALAGAAGVRVSSHCSHTLHAMDAYRPVSGRLLKATYGGFTTFFESLGAPPAPLEAPLQV